MIVFWNWFILASFQPVRFDLPPERLLKQKHFIIIGLFVSSIKCLVKKLCYCTSLAAGCLMEIWYVARQSPFTHQRDLELRWKGIRHVGKAKGTVLWMCCDWHSEIPTVHAALNYSIEVTERRNDIHFHFMTNINSTANINWNKLCNLLCMW